MTTETHNADQDIDLFTDPEVAQVYFAHAIETIAEVHDLFAMWPAFKVGDTHTHAIAADLEELLRIIIGSLTDPEA